MFIYQYTSTGVPPLLVGDTQWMAETVDSTEPYVHYVFSYIYIPMIKLNLQIRHSQRLTIINKIEKLKPDTVIKIM